MKEKREEGDLYFFETIGFSMWPFLKAGQRLIIKRTSIEDLKIGDVILYLANNQRVCHRLIKKIRHRQGQFLYARGDNSASSPELVSEEMFLGKVAGIVRNGKIISLDGMRQRLVNLVIVRVAPLVSRVNRMIKPWYSTLKRQRKGDRRCPEKQNSGQGLHG
jgi:signal peptidase I